MACFLKLNPPTIFTQVVSEVTIEWRWNARGVNNNTDSLDKTHGQLLRSCTSLQIWIKFGWCAGTCHHGMGSLRQGSSVGNRDCSSCQNTKLLTDVATRWNSSFYTIERFLEHCCPQTWRKMQMLSTLIESDTECAEDIAKAMKPSALLCRLWHLYTLSSKCPG